MPNNKTETSKHLPTIEYHAKEVRRVDIEPHWQ